MLRLLVIAALLLVGNVAFAEPTATIEWTNPVNGIDSTTGAVVPLTEDSKITYYHLWLSSTPLNTLPTEPTVVLNATTPLQTSYVYPGQSGQTIYARMKVCNKYGCSTPSVQVQGEIPWPPVVPGSPQNVTIRITL